MVNESMIFWTYQNVPRPKNTFLGLEYDKSGNQVPSFDFLENMKNMLTQIQCIMAQTLFQTSSRGSDLKQHRFGRQIKNTVNMQS